MRKTLYIIALSSVMACFSSCSDWFDVAPKTDVTASKLFSTEEGFVSALEGVYVGMTEGSSYGDNLTFGFIDFLAQIYDQIPRDNFDPNQFYNYRGGGEFGANRKVEDIWKSSYNLIANINNLLSWLDKQGKEVIKNQETLNTLYGEAYALRAFLHFDILRCWGNMEYSYNPLEEDRVMPYRVKIGTEKEPKLKTSEVLARIIADLEAGKSYLSFEKDIKLKEDIADPQGQRRFRLNYHAINALLARVHCYNNDAENAIKHAKEAIEKCGLTLSTDNEEDPALAKETLFGVNLEKMKETLGSKFAEVTKFTSHYYTDVSKFENIFEVKGSSVGDFRAKMTAIHRVAGAEKVISRKYTENRTGIIPLIKLAELYYIIAEMSELGEEAASYLNVVRNKRGISISEDVVFDTEETRTEALDREYRKEFYAEGQYFFFLKRKGITKLEHESRVTLNKSKFVFPLPHAEIEYGWTEEEENQGENNSNN